MTIADPVVKPISIQITTMYDFQATTQRRQAFVKPDFGLSRAKIRKGNQEWD